MQLVQTVESRSRVSKRKLRSSSSCWKCSSNPLKTICRLMGPSNLYGFHCLSVCQYVRISVSRYYSELLEFLSLLRVLVKREQNSCEGKRHSCVFCLLLMQTSKRWFFCRSSQLLSESEPCQLRVEDMNEESRDKSNNT